MEVRSKNIEDWFAVIRNGQITLPRFQRFEAWYPSQVVGVLENVLRQPSLPIGTLLTLEVGGKELFHSRPISGAPVPNGLLGMNLLDGQQRITALWRALTDHYQDSTFFVSLDNENQPEIKIQKRHLHAKSKKRMPLWADDPAATIQRELFPVSLLRPGSEGEKATECWINSAGADLPIYRRILKLRQRLAAYQIPFLSLRQDTEQETALDVFVKMNTSASPLKDYDIVVAQLEAAVGDSLHDKITELEKKVPHAAGYGKIEDVALAIGALINDKPPLKRTYLDRAFAQELADVWDKVCLGLERGVNFLRDETIFNEKLLPSEVILYMTSALWANTPTEGTDQEGRARTLIRKAVWRASFTERYQRTATTRAFADYKAILALINDSNSTHQPDLFDEQQNPLPEAEKLIASRWPTRKDRLGRAIIAVSLYGGGYDFADGSKATAENVQAREYHHIYPKSLIQDCPDQEVNSALNCALISWKTNRTIAAKSPGEYLNERATDANATKEQVRDRLQSHRIPYDDLIKGDFKTFIEKRAEIIHAAMTKLCNGDVP